MADIGVFPMLVGQGWSVIKGPTFQTRIQRAVSGRELRASDYPAPLWQFALTYNLLRDSAPPQNDLHILMGFFMACQGSLATFLYDDPTDNAVDGQVLGLSDGTTTAFQLVRTMGLGAIVKFNEPIVAPNSVSAIYVNGIVCSDWSVDPTTGLLTFAVAPPAGSQITADFTFYFRCRFTADAYNFENFMKGLWSLKQLTFISVRP